MIYTRHCVLKRRGARGSLLVVAIGILNSRLSLRLLSARRPHSALFHTDRFDRSNSVAFGMVWVDKNIDRLSQFNMHSLWCIAAELVHRICPGVCLLGNDDLSGTCACCEYGICDSCDDTGMDLPDSLI